MKIKQAEYAAAILPEHRGNPLIESLPRKVSGEELVRELSVYPPHSEEEQKLPAFERVEYLSRLKELRQPVPLYLDFYRAIEIAIKEGYSSKNPFSPTTQNYLHYASNQRPEVMPRTGFFKPRGTGITIIGESGVGKTCMIEQVLNCFPDVILHQEYDDQLLNFQQVVWIKIDCPDDSSVRALCHKILSELDLKMGQPQTKPASTIALLLGQIETRIKSSFLGILVIDEMQNLNTAKAGGADRLLSFLHNLVNNLGIPILFCANPPFDKYLAKTLKAARRAESSGYYNVDLMDNDETWELFIESLWELQWTSKTTPLLKELSDKLFQLSIGNMDLAVRIFREAQRCVIGSPDESITIEVLEYAAGNATGASSSIVNTMRKDRYLQKLKNIKQQKSESREIDTDYESNKGVTLPVNNKIVSIPGDLTRPQHQEFSEKITLILESKNLHTLISNTDLIQQAAREKSPTEYLRDNKIFCDSPLETFA